MNTVEKAALILCQSDDPCCKGEGCDHGKELYADAVRAILTAWAENPPEVMVEAMTGFMDGHCERYIEKEEARQFLIDAFQAALDEK